MRISELIAKLQRAKAEHGDLDVLMECSNDISINSVCYVDKASDQTHIRLTDDTDAIYEIYGEDPEDTEMIVEEI